MSKGNFLLRNSKNEVTNVISEGTANNLKNSKKVVCDTVEIKERITKWTQNIAWTFEDFTTLVEQIGVKTPIRLSEVTSENPTWGKAKDSFKCTASNTEIKLITVFDEEISEIWVVDREETRKYEVKRNWIPGETIPKASFYEKIVKRNGKEIKSLYFSTGKMYGYEVCEKGERFMVYAGGDWNYETDGVEIRYLAERKEYSFSVTGGKNKVMTTPKIEQILIRVEEKISKLMKFVR